MTPTPHPSITTLQQVYDQIHYNSLLLVVYIGILSMLLSFLILVTADSRR